MNDLGESDVAAVQKGIDLNSQLEVKPLGAPCIIRMQHHSHLLKIR